MMEKWLNWHWLHPISYFIHDAELPMAQSTRPNPAKLKVFVAASTVVVFFLPTLSADYSRVYVEYIGFFSFYFSQFLASPPLLSYTFLGRVPFKGPLAKSSYAVFFALVPSVSIYWEVMLENHVKNLFCGLCLNAVLLQSFSRLTCSALIKLEPRWHYQVSYWSESGKWRLCCGWQTRTYTRAHIDGNAK